jgi:uncharacterized RDD family membrane protein YckC
VTPRRLGALERLPQAVAEQVVRRIVEMLDINEIVQRIDLDQVMSRVDVNAIVQRVDVNAVVAKVDANELVDTIDIDRLLERVDINAIAERIDIDELVKRADLGPIIAQSTSGMLGEFLGLLRRWVVGLDGLLDVVTLHRRRAEGKPTGPAALASLSQQRGGETREGHYAGGVTRLLAFALDVAAVWGLFLLLANGAQAAVRLFAGTEWSIFSHRAIGIAAICVWWVVYFTFQWGLSGRTIGMAVFGARVVTTEGSAVSHRAALIRALVLPLSVALFFVCLVTIVLRADRRAFHDWCASTVVVYFWEARGASLPWLHREP